MAFFSNIMEAQNSISNKINARITSGYQVRMPLYFGMAWDLVKRNMGLFVTYTMIYAAFLVLAWKLGDVGRYMNFILNGPIIAGYYIMIHRMVTGKAYSFENFFDGFKIFLPVMAASMASGLLTGIGALFFIIPGLIIAQLLMFVLPLVIFGRTETWSALKFSQMIIWRQFWDMTKFGVIILLMNLASAFTFGIATLITVPLSFAAIYFAYTDIIGIEEKPEDEKPDFSHFR